MTCGESFCTTCGRGETLTNTAPKLDPPVRGKKKGNGTRVRCFMLKEYEKGLLTVNRKIMYHLNKSTCGIDLSSGLRLCIVVRGR